MSNATTSVRVFGAYVLILGCALMAVPNVVLAPFGIPPTPEAWIRVAGVLVVVIGCYYLLAARSESVWFYRATGPARSFVCLSFCAFAVLRLAHPALALFGSVDLGGAAWTFFALRAADRRRARASAV